MEEKHQVTSDWKNYAEQSAAGEAAYSMSREGRTSGKGTEMKPIRMVVVALALATGLAGSASADLVAYYEFEGNANDASANNLHGTAYGGPAYVDGVFGQALSLDGINDYVDLPIGQLIGSLSDCTIAIWANWSGLGGLWQRIFDFGSGMSSYMFLTPTGGTSMRFAIFKSPGLEYQADAPSNLAPGWHHVAVVINGTVKSMQLYLDGNVVGTASTQVLPKDLGNTTQNWLGKSQYPDPYYNGSLDDLRIYDHALSEQEVLQLCQIQQPEDVNGFTYQGRLMDGDIPADGQYDFEFRLFDDGLAGTQQGSTNTIEELDVIEGFFMVQLDFGDEVVNGRDRWLQIGVRPGSSAGSYAILEPRQIITPTPYALYAFSGPGGGTQGPQGLPGSADAWSRLGNAGTTTANFLGTADNQSLELRVNNARVLRLVPNATSPNIIGGFSGNSITSGVYGATISGGGKAGLGWNNDVTDNYGTVAGGINNMAGDKAGTTSNAQGATVGGGVSNNATGDSSTVCGGSHNTAMGYKSFAAGNYAKANHDGAFVWGDSSTGVDVASTGDNQFVVRASGGVYFKNTGDVMLVLEADTDNVNEGDNPGILFSQDGGIVEGFLGYAEGTNRLLLENRYNDRLMLKSPGGIYLHTNAGETTGMYISAGGSGWNAVSDRAMKDNIREVDGKDILNKLNGLPISQWNYKTQDPSIEHIGPMAQDFHAAFGLSDDDKSINSIDSDGVALAAIQGLYQITKEKDAEIEHLKGRLSKLEFLQKENEGLRERLATLEAMVAQVIQEQKEGR